MTREQAASRYIEDPDGTLVLLHRVVGGVERVEVVDVGPRHPWSLAHPVGHLSPLAVRVREVCR